MTSRLTSIRSENVHVCLIVGPAGFDDLILRSSGSDALDLLPGWYDDWALVEPERLRECVLHGLEVLCYCLVEVGRFVKAIEVGMTAVAVEPLRETAQRTLLKAPLAEGNRIEGKRCLSSYRALLRRALGVEPAADPQCASQCAPVLLIRALGQSADSGCRPLR